MDPLVVSGVAKSFGGIVAVDDVSFALHQNEILGLIGPNGAGKSTVLGVLAGAIAADRGSVRVEGTSIGRLGPHGVARLGLRRCYQLARTLQPLSVLENMLVGAQARDHTTLRAVVLHPRRSRTADAEVADEAMTFLRRFDLDRLADAPAGSLSGGQRKLLSIGQAMMGHPQILVLDEPVAGVHPSFVDSVAGLLRDIRAGGVSLLVVEHNLRFLEAIADRVVVMARGRVLTEGSLSDVRQRDEVAQAYLGHSDATTTGGTGVRVTVTPETRPRADTPPTTNEQE